MSADKRADAYLTIPAAYSEALGGLQWAYRYDAIERRDGTTLALVEEITSYLEGLFTSSHAVPFAFALHLLEIFKQRTPGLLPDECGRLRRAYEASAGVVGLARNAGVFAAELCSNLPRAAGPLSGSQVLQALARRRLNGARTSPFLIEEPPLSPADFTWQIADRLRRFDDDALRHWLKFGNGPTPAGKPLAVAVDSLPARLLELQQLARRSPRLVGALALAPTVDAALTLPPRKRSADPLPQGGYTDVTTRGEPERLLPGQYALDPDEFIRRFASHELLYFQREEPHAPDQPRRLIVLDQGVRTWGSVRLGLAAAALALLTKDPKRSAGLRLATTASPTLDVAECDAVALANRLEASDLSPHPADGLRTALQECSREVGLWDIVLLTHPRNLRESMVSAAAHARRPTDRLFALAVDDQGRAELAEWTDGGLVPVRTFRVDLAAGEAARVEGQPAAPRTGVPVGTWTGAVEPIPFPFRPGIVSELETGSFDAEGDWFVACGRDGVPHGIAFDGSPPEVLPRGFREGAILRQVETILGVTGGVVVCGRMAFHEKSGASPPATTTSLKPNTIVADAGASSYETPCPSDAAISTQYAAVHYDRATRTATLHLLGTASGNALWSVFPELNCIVVRQTAPQETVGCALDLSTHGQFPGPKEDALRARAQAAWHKAKLGIVASPRTLRVVTRWTSTEIGQNFPTLYLWGNAVELHGTEILWRRFEPMREGKPLLGGMSIISAQLAADVLALVLSHNGERSLALFRGPDGSLIREHKLKKAGLTAVLSADGQHYARGVGTGILSISKMDGTPRDSAMFAKLHSNTTIELFDPFELVIRVGTTEHRFRVVNEQLEHRRQATQAGKKRPTHVFPGSPCHDDPVRFPMQQSFSAGRKYALLDRLGQVLVFDANSTLLVNFIVRRSTAAAWLPDGTFWGDPALIGGPPTPDAARKIARVLLGSDGG